MEKQHILPKWSRKKKITKIKSEISGLEAVTGENDGGRDPSLQVLLRATIRGQTIDKKRPQQSSGAHFDLWQCSRAIKLKHVLKERTGSLCPHPPITQSRPAQGQVTVVLIQGGQYYQWAQNLEIKAKNKTNKQKKPHWMHPFSTKEPRGNSLRVPLIGKRERGEWPVTQLWGPFSFSLPRLLGRLWSWDVWSLPAAARAAWSRFLSSRKGPLSLLGCVLSKREVWGCGGWEPCALLVGMYTCTSILKKIKLELPYDYMYSLYVLYIYGYYST